MPESENQPEIEPIALPALERLAGIMKRLRGPGGCPWDAKQDERTLVPYLIEETYELVDAIEQGGRQDRLEELGDVLLQVVFQAEIAREQGDFDLDDVARGIGEKLIRRHPHVFGEDTARDAGEALERWETIKRGEKEAARAGEGEPAAGHGSILDGVPRQLPALLAAYRISEKVAGVGFDWPDAPAAWQKVEEEIGELRDAMARNARDEVREELGDLFFILANLCRKLGLEPEETLRAANTKFKRRFAFIERELRESGKTPEDSDLVEMNELWELAKREGGAGGE